MNILATIPMEGIRSTATSIGYAFQIVLSTGSMDAEVKYAIYYNRCMIVAEY